MDHEFFHDCMAEHPDDLLVAFKKEKDVKVLRKILVVLPVLEDDMEIWEAVKIVRCCQKSLRFG